MNKEKIMSEVSDIKTNVMLEFPTGFGKSKCALEIVKNNHWNKVLIVIPRLVLENNWNEEIKKWNAKIPEVTYVTYVSLYKHADIQYDAIIFDECHHLSDNCLDIINTLKYKQAILLSATVSRNKWYDILSVPYLPFALLSKDEISRTHSLIYDEKSTGNEDITIPRNIIETYLKTDEKVI